MRGLWEEQRGLEPELLAKYCSATWTRGKNMNLIDLLSVDIVVSLLIRVAVSLWTMSAKGVMDICRPQNEEQERHTDSTAHAHITGVSCCVGHYLLDGQWSSHQDDSTLSLRKIANTAKSRETKLQAQQEKQSLLSQSWNPVNSAQRLCPGTNNTFFQGYITKKQTI